MTDHHLNGPNKNQRRCEPRMRLVRPVKIHSPQLGRYWGAKTLNLSGGGALLDLTRSCPLVPGQRIRLGIAGSDRQSLIRYEQMLDATVMRCARVGDSQNLALQFEQRQELAAAG